MDGMNSRFSLEEGGMLQDRYRIECLLGSNGLSITYEAFDTFREQKMIIKELFPAAMVERSKNDQRTVSCLRLVHESDFSKMKEHMIREAKLLIQLYPLEGIANVITFFEENQTIYLVMEFVEGMSLPDYMKKIHMPKLLLKDAFAILKPIIMSLEKAHEKGAVHGKINPSLVYIKQGGGAVLLGFGDPMEDAALAVAEDATARVPGYAPVEQYVDQSGFGPATDIYAIAAILYEMTTGHRVPAFYERISEENPKGQDPLMPPAYYNGTIMDYQSKAIMKALSVYHFDRYQSLLEFAQAISEEEFVDTYQIRMREKPVKFAQIQKYYRIIGWTGGICLAFLLLFFGPKAFRYSAEYQAKQFYTDLMKADLYEQCDMIAELPLKKRAVYANDYTQMEEEGEHIIHYYDMITSRLVSRDKLKLDADIVRYVTVDYRQNNKMILTIVMDGITTTYEIQPIKQKGSQDAGYRVVARTKGTSGADGVEVYQVVKE